MKDRDVATGAEERVGQLFVPDSMLPSQYFDRVARRTEYDGERRLMVAVLEDAVDVYRKLAGAHDGRRQQLFRDAEEWIESNDRNWIFSFQNICDVLGIEAEYLRRGLRTIKAQALTQGQVVPLAPTVDQDVEPQKATGS
jgi:hypothetical protein